MPEAESPDSTVSLTFGVVGDAGELEKLVSEATKAIEIKKLAL